MTILCSGEALSQLIDAFEKRFLGRRFQRERAIRSLGSRRRAVQIGMESAFVKCTFY
jgi:predicted component of type VI protein secretion system